MKTVSLLLTAAVLLAGCEKSPVSKSSTDNPDVTVELLFTHEGCRVYRFVDDNRDHYYTNCRGETIDPEHRQGKVSVPENTISTERVQ